MGIVERDQNMNEEENGKRAGSGISAGSHPLMDYLPLSFGTFSEWRALWRKEKYFHQRMGLLHALTDSWWQDCELVSFLLSVADGFFRTCNFSSGSNDFRITEMRREIAKKAFSILCSKFFKGGVRDDKLPLWWWALEQEELLEKVLWFLRPGNTVGLRNPIPPDGHIREIYSSFLREIAHLAWVFQYPGETLLEWQREKVEPAKTRLIRARPQLVYVLDELREIEWLNERDLELDEPTIAKLKELALEGKVWLPSDGTTQGDASLRKPNNIREAVLGGSVEAMTVLISEVKQRERERIRRLFEESRRKVKNQKKQSS
ncbi:MAG: hypothetical protein A2427_01625 [Candidatus Nealsonbacteria bacterium RIFOXYC1_FULL_40_7]|uniref:Uncharacterized protein n=1 Tax=Candidatus Nealsonbacteria bacterium RIFOXYC1_FULL_40_7 TaxID=1801678 RepID=A0A1G2EP22_9BACT|nr:MAG: hypothetical protein A2427_01625 [Candidatus Nealsonbacteria bacterium RIFOXYC1_FULL_40_7]OGZ28174.1 MAG: hypothetical protein A2562_03035 [Candidatus Nealsonbacteria bacterium RIFOXYD1_FULL_39_11]